MTAFIDTSALYAALDAADPAHPRVAAVLDSRRGTELVTHNYVIVETVALVQRRLGISAVRDLTGSLLRPVRVVWIDQAVHGGGVDAVLASRQRRVSLVDHISFQVMRREGITTAIAVDADFEVEGFDVLPADGN